MCDHRPIHHYLKTQISSVSGTTSNHLLTLLLWDPCLTSTDWHVSLRQHNPNSGAWMNCLPSTAIGTLLDNESFRFAISQRLGLPVCAPRKCCCGTTVDKYSLHPLSYRLNTGRLPRHSTLNDIIKRALSSAGFNSVLEPVDLDREDGKRPDGIIVFPFSSGKRLIWDSTCVDYFPSQHWL